MRHRKKRSRLSRTSSHREAMLENLAASLLLKERVKTTLPKAKEARKVAEKLITLGKKNDLHSRRRAFRILSDHKIVKILFDEIAPLFKDRNGGYTRIIPANFRAGDGAPMAFLELLERREKITPPKGREEKKTEVAEGEEKKPKTAKVPKPKKVKSTLPPEPVKPAKLAKPKEELKPPKPEAKPPQPAKGKEKPRGLFGRIKGFFKKKK